MYKNPKFSLIVPVYNVEKYVAYCMESVIEQTLKDLEIICINDGSTDNSLSIIEKYQEIDNRIKIIDKKNGGLASARNFGLKEATGDYILFVDSDDYLDVHACDRLYIEFMQTNADIVVFGGTAFPQHSAANNFWLKAKLNVVEKYYYQDTIKALFQENASVPFVWNKCYRKEFIEINDFVFDEELLYGEDTPFLFNTFPAASEISFIADKLYYYRCSSEGSLMAIAKRNPKWKLEMHLKLVEKILLYWKEKLYLSEAMDDLYIWILDFFIHDLEDMDIAKDDKEEICHGLNRLIESYDLHFSKKKKIKYLRMEKRLKSIIK